MGDESLIIERDGNVTLLRINRPLVHNALNADLLRRIAAAVGSAADDGTRAVVLTGTGQRSFSAGADLDELAGLDAEAARRVLAAGQATFRGIERSPIPVIAAVNGLALGGGFELVLACSFALVATSATLGLPETGLGLIPGYGGTQRLPRAIGAAAARHVMLTGQRIDAERAYQLGLVVVPPTTPGELLPAAMEMARKIGQKGPSACRSVLEAVDRSYDMPIADGLAFETMLAALAVAGRESGEGIAAFREKRPPVFSAGPGS